MSDWESIENDREKYSAYLCSREWAVLKEAVHKRANGKCERCGIFPIDAVHHLNYDRKYREELTDLEGHCQHCHAYTHGKHWFDPEKSHKLFAWYFQSCIGLGVPPVPTAVLCQEVELSFHSKEIMRCIDVLVGLMNSIVDTKGIPIYEALNVFDSKLPFNYKGYSSSGMRYVNSDLYNDIGVLLGCDMEADCSSIRIDQ